MGKLQDTGSTDTISRGPKMSLWSPNQNWSIRSSDKQCSFNSGPFHSGSSNRPCGFSPVADSVIEIYILNNWQNSYFGSMTCGVKAIMIIKTNPKLLKLHLPRTTVTQKQYCIPRGIAKRSALIKDLKDAGMVSPITSSFNSPNWPVHEISV